MLTVVRMLFLLIVNRSLAVLTVVRLFLLLAFLSNTNTLTTID